MLWRTAVIFKLFWAFWGLGVSCFLHNKQNRPSPISVLRQNDIDLLFSQLCWNLSICGVNKRLAHAQVGFLNRFNSKFPMSIPGPFKWESPPVKNIHIAWQRDSVTAWHVTKNSKNPVRGGSSSGHFSRLTSGRELTVLPPARGFPFNLWDRVVVRTPPCTCWAGVWGPSASSTVPPR